MDRFDIEHLRKTLRPDLDSFRVIGRANWTEEFKLNPSFVPLKQLNLVLPNLSRMECESIYG